MKQQKYNYIVIPRPHGQCEIYKIKVEREDLLKLFLETFEEDARPYFLGDNIIEMKEVVNEGEPNV